MHPASRDLRALFDVGVLTERSDAALLNRFVERRESAIFEAIIRRHGPMVWGVCRRVLRDDHDAEDAFQAAFLVLARKAAQVMPREKLGNWLYGVAFQTAIKARAMRMKRRTRESQVSTMPEREGAREDIRDDLTELLDHELVQLPQKYRIPIVLCELQGKSLNEASAELGWPVGTVSSRLSRAKSMLATRLARRGVSLAVGSFAWLLAQESAFSSMPPRLIGSTARAASLIAGRVAVTAGLVSAEVATLTGEVLKVMLLSKLKIATAVLLSVSILALGGTGLAYRVQAVESSQKNELEARHRREESRAPATRREAEGREGARKIQVRSRPSSAPTEEERSALTELLFAGTHSPEQLETMKDVIDEMINFEKEIKDKSNEELDTMIEQTYWEARLVEFRLRRLKEIRGATVNDASTDAAPSPRGFQQPR